MVANNAEVADKGILSCEDDAPTKQIGVNTLM
jgi:hypothetical protein